MRGRGGVGGSSLLVRFWRRVSPGANPLARVWDRIEGLLLVFLIGGALLAIPFAAAFGSDTYAAETALIAQEHRDRVPVTASTLAEAPMQVYSTDAVATSSGTTAVAAVWTDARGMRHTGQVQAAAGSPVGTAVPVWTDQRGTLTDEPLDASSPVPDGIFGALLVWSGVAAVLAGIFWAGRRILDRIRRREWDQALVDVRYDSRY